MHLPTVCVLLSALVPHPVFGLGAGGADRQLAAQPAWHGGAL